MLHPLCNNVDSFLTYTNLKDLCSDYYFEWDTSDPEYLIVSEHINTNQIYRNIFESLYKRNNIKIYFAGEAEYPDFNLYDYALGFSKDLQLKDRYCSLPSPYMFFNNFVSTRVNNLIDKESAKKILSLKTGFCNFLYSNPNAHPMRDQLFWAISKYKKVDSMGKHLNNVSESGTGFVGYSHECTLKKSPYKFSIASENATFPGYTTEKILTSLEAHTIPIYWGDPQVYMHINPKCFINCNEIKSIEEVINLIEKIDKDDELWCEMISEPWQLKSQQNFDKKLDNEYFEFFRNIFNMNTKDATRIPQGTRPEIYRSYYFHAKSNRKSKSDLIKYKLKLLFKK